MFIFMVWATLHRISVSKVSVLRTKRNEIKKLESFENLLLRVTQNETMKKHVREHIGNFLRCNL